MLLTISLIPAGSQQSAPAAAQRTAKWQQLKTTNLWGQTVWSVSCIVASFLVFLKQGRGQGILHILAGPHLRHLVFPKHSSQIPTWCHPVVNFCSLFIFFPNINFIFFFSYTFFCTSVEFAPMSINPFWCMMVIYVGCLIQPTSKYVWCLEWRAVQRS